MTTSTTRPDTPAVRGSAARALLRPAVGVGIIIGLFGLADTGPFEPASPITGLLPLLALAYLLFGFARGAFHQGHGLTRQLVGLVLFGGVALVVLVVDPAVGRYLVAAGWLGHAVWDYLHRDGRVVPRWYIEVCIPVDVVVAASLIVAPLL
jgi:hypothetical protein